jgi:cytochrome c oxidase subunit 2
MSRFHSKSFVYGLLPALCALAILAAAQVACGIRPARAPAADSRPAGAGAELFESLECIHCHQMNGGGPGPSLAGLYGEPVRLEGGERVTADETYIRRSILDPTAQVHAGYQPIMPPYAGRIDEGELSVLVEYIRSLSEEAKE